MLRVCFEVQEWGRAIGLGVRNSVRDFLDRPLGWEGVRAVAVERVMKI